MIKPDDIGLQLAQAEIAAQGRDRPVIGVERRVEARVEYSADIANRPILNRSRGARVFRLGKRGKPAEARLADPEGRGRVVDITR